MANNTPDADVRPIERADETAPAIPRPARSDAAILLTDGEARPSGEKSPAAEAPGEEQADQAADRPVATAVDSPGADARTPLEGAAAPEASASTAAPFEFAAGSAAFGAAAPGASVGEDASLVNAARSQAGTIVSGAFVSGRPDPSS